MNFAKYEWFISRRRLDRYLSACKGDIEKTVDLYEYNIQVSQALYPLISIFEIALRNGIDRVLIKKFQDNNWLVTQRVHFSQSYEMVYKDSFGIKKSDEFFNEKLAKAERKLRLNNTPVTHANLIAELTFGFWVKFYASNSIKILKGAPLDVFKNKPSKKLQLVHSHLNSIVTLRNRIAHSEPICFNRAGELCLETIENYETHVMDALGWLDYDLQQWAEKMNSFRPVYEKIAAI